METSRVAFSKFSQSYYTIFKKTFNLTALTQTGTFPDEVLAVLMVIEVPSPLLAEQWATHTVVIVLHLKSWLDNEPHIQQQQREVIEILESFFVLLFCQSPH